MLAKGHREEFAGALEHYLGNTLHNHIRVDAFEGAPGLPNFIKRSYRLYESVIAGQRCVFLVAGANHATPSDIAKHVTLVRPAVDAIIVFVAPSLTVHDRSRLIARGIAFVVPGNQLYIPELAMDLREYFRAPRSRRVDRLSPAAQAVLFHHVLHLNEYATTPSTIAGRLHYSAMSIGRAFDELVAFGLAKAERHGQEKRLRFNADRRATLEAARPLLRNPARSVKHIRNGHIMPKLKWAGESALAELTDLSRPQRDTYAIAASDWKAIAESFDLREVDETESNFVVETWSYDPAGLSDARVVDPLSLYAQFWDHPDERVSLAAESLLKNLPW
jgi:hypothetical protein